MRLSVLDHGHRPRARIFLIMTSLTAGLDSPDIVRTLLYRPEFLTRPLLDLTAEAMRGPSYWTAGEREYLAMNIARRHECPFCLSSHAELTRIAGQGEIDPDDPASARPGLRAIRDFLTAPGLEDPDRVRAAGVPRQAVIEALHVGLVWNIVNRLANAFGFELRGDQLHTGTRALHRFGYRFPGFLLSGGDQADHGGPVENIRHSVFDAPATTDPGLRKAAATGEGLPQPWGPYTATVRDASYRVADADVERLVAAGHSEDEIFEVTVAAAAGAALREFETALDAIRTPW